jgi:hypothetical protein
MYQPISVVKDEIQTQIALGPESRRTSAGSDRCKYIYICRHTYESV